MPKSLTKCKIGIVNTKYYGYDFKNVLSVIPFFILKFDLVGSLLKSIKRKSICMTFMTMFRTGKINLEMKIRKL